VWAVHEQAADPVAQRFYADARVLYRTLVVPGTATIDAAGGRRAARTALFFVRRGFNYVPTAIGLHARRDFRRFRRGTPARPRGVAPDRTRTRLAAA
jgi:hypothetical protein